MNYHTKSAQRSVYRDVRSLRDFVTFHKVLRTLIVSPPSTGHPKGGGGRSPASISHNYGLLSLAADFGSLRAPRLSLMGHIDNGNRSHFSVYTLTATGLPAIVASLLHFIYSRSRTPCKHLHQLFHQLDLPQLCVETR